MSKKLDSVRRSLFQEFDDSVNDDSFEKMGNSSHQKSSSKRSTSIKMNSTAIAVVVILTVVIAAFSNKMVQILLRDLSIELAQKYDASLEWTQNNYTYLMQPAFYGILVSIFTMMIIYFDSDIPGVNPPTPFSPRKANQIRYADHREKTNNLGFLVSIGSGIVTFFLLYL